MLAWECVDMLYEWTGAAGVSPPHLGVNERVQPGYLPLTYVVYEMVQLGYLPLTLIWMNWCSWGISPSPHCSASRMAEAVGSASIGHRSDTFVSDRCLVGVGPGVFAMWDQDARMYFCIFIWCMYMLCSIWYVWNWIPDPISSSISTSATPHKSQSFTIFAPANHVYLKNKLPPPISRYCMFLYTAPHLKKLLCTPGVFMPHVLCTDIPRFVTTNKIPSNLGGRGS